MTVSKDTAIVVARELMKLSDALGIAATDSDKTINASKGAARAWLESYQADRYRMSEEVRGLCDDIVGSAK